MTSAAVNPRTAFDRFLTVSPQAIRCLICLQEYVGITRPALRELEFRRGLDLWRLKSGNDVPIPAQTSPSNRSFSLSRDRQLKALQIRLLAEIVWVLRAREIFGRTGSVIGCSASSIVVDNMTDVKF